MDPFSYDAFELPKVTVMRWVSGVILALWIFHQWGFKPDWKKDKEEKFSWRKCFASPLHLPVFYFALVLIVCSIFTIDPLSSLKGTYKRQEGLFTLLNYIFLFFAAAHFTRGEKKIRACLSLCIAAGTLTSLYAVLQHFGFDIFSTKGEERSFSTLNHPNFLAAYLVLVMPFAFARMLEAYGSRVKDGSGARGAQESKNAGVFGAVLYATCFQLMVLALLFTYCRGAWVGHVFSLIVVLAFVGKDMLNKCRIPLAALFASLVFLTVLANQPTIHRGPFSLATRAASIVDTKNTTVVTRFIMWKCALKVIKAHPFTGVGLDGFKAIFPMVKPAEYVKYEGLHITADKAHNETLHITATLGFAGFLGYIWIFVCAAFLFFKLFLSHFSSRSRFPDSVYLSAVSLFASFSGYILQNQFSFSVITTGMVSFMALGLLSSCWMLCMKPEEAAGGAVAVEKLKGKKKKEKRAKERDAAPEFNFLSAPVPVLLCILIGVISYRPYAADHFFLKGELYGQAGYNNDQIAFFEKAVVLNPYEEQYFIKLGEAYEKKALTEPHAIHSAADAYKKASELAPLNPYNFSKMGKAYVTLAKTEDKKWYDEALSVLETARKLDPYNPVFLNNLAAVYNDTKQPEKSLPLLEYSLKLTPEYTLALNNMGNALVQLKKFQEGEKYFKKAYNLEKTNVTSMAGLGYCAFQERKHCEAKKWFEKLLSVSPDNKIARRFFDIVKTQNCP